MILILRTIWAYSSVAKSAVVFLGVGQVFSESCVANVAISISLPLCFIHFIYSTNYRFLVLYLSKILLQLYLKAILHPLFVLVIILAGFLFALGEALLRVVLIAFLNMIEVLILPIEFLLLLTVILIQILIKISL